MRTIAAALLTFLFLGAGQMYNGQPQKGFLILFGGMIIALLSGGWGIIPIWLFASLEAAAVRDRIEAGCQVGPWTTF